MTDDKDRLLLTTILSTCYCHELVDLGPSYSLTPSGTYHAPEDGPRSNYITFVDALPLAQAPEAFGLHANAAITKDINATDLMLHSLLAMSGGSGGASGSGGAEASAAEARVAAVVQECLEKLPPPFDLEAAAAKFPQSYQESLNTVLVQEMARYNKLCGLLRESLKSIAAALKGLLVMSSELEAAYKSISLNQVGIRQGNASQHTDWGHTSCGVRLDKALLLSQAVCALSQAPPVIVQVPDLWKRVSYPSLRPLGSYLSDLYRRLDMLSSWAAAGKPPSVFWLPGFFFVQSFLTAGELLGCRVTKRCSCHAQQAAKMFALSCASWAP